MNFRVYPEQLQTEPRAIAPRSYAANPDILKGLVICAEALLIVLAAIGALILTDVRPYGMNTYQTFSTIFVALVYLALGLHVGLFEVSALTRPLKRSDDVIVSVLTSGALLLSVLFSLDLFDYVGSAWIAAFGAGAVGVLLVFRFGLARVLRALWRRGVIGRNLIVIGVGPQAERFLQRFRTARPYFMSIAGVFSGVPGPPPVQIEGHRVLGGIEQAIEAARQGAVDDVVIAMPWQEDERVQAALEQLKQLPVSVHLGTDLVGYALTFRPASGPMRELPMFELVQRPIAGWGAVLKRIEDYAIASALLLMLSPLMLIVALAVRLDSPGPILFRQQRLGFNNRVFYIYKFRSMKHCPGGETSVRQAIRNDDRVTRVGRFIRATSLDELPQLLNVLDGTMSLVGPRPHAVSHNLEYGRQIRGYFARHKVKPGITGWAQVNGFRGETSTLDLMESRVQHDVYYAENWSLLFDLRILIRTALVVLFQRNAY